MSGGSGNRTSAATRLRSLLTAARLRVAARTAGFGAAPMLVLAAAAFRLGGGNVALLAALASALVLALVVPVAVRRLDSAWLARRLDDRDPRMEDSAGLLFADAAALSPLQLLQRERLASRLTIAVPPELRPRWHGRAMSGVVTIALASAAAIAAWPTPAPDPASDASTITNDERAATHTRVTSQQLHIQPPAYTGLPSRQQATLAARVPEGSRLRWSLRLSPQPGTAHLQFHDGVRVALRRQGDAWTAERRIDAPLLYRIVVTGAPALRPDRLHRIDVVADRPPQLRTVAPASTLTLRGAQQRTWSVAFEARDDHGLAPNASLRITTARGSGENIAFAERELVLAGTGEARRRRYSHTFVLDALGLSPGDDLIVQLSVSDRRPGRPQTTRSASYLLRWPPEAAVETTGVTGVLARTLPAYFRSQRQVILDTEALLAQRRKIAATEFGERSDAIGVDQRLLRLRYGQFLGEETEVGEQPLLPTADAESEAHAEEPASDAPAVAEEPAGEHAHETPAAPARFGEAGDVLEAFGHTHDESEAATLFDPETRRLLKAALDQMWQAELHLRQAHPERALPYEYKALEFIKQVQQADRVYVAKVGSQQPPIDESRRLSGKRDGLVPPRDVLVPARDVPTAPADLWRALGRPAGGIPATALEEAERWLRARSAQAPDALAAIAALDEVRRDPHCADCRERLRRQLWTLLPRPPAAPLPRTRPDAAGQAYLDALRTEDTR